MKNDTLRKAKMFFFFQKRKNILVLKNSPTGSTTFSETTVIKLCCFNAVIKASKSVNFTKYLS